MDVVVFDLEVDVGVFEDGFFDCVVGFDDEGGVIGGRKC